MPSLVDCNCGLLEIVDAALHVFAGTQMELVTAAAAAASAGHSDPGRSSLIRSALNGFADDLFLHCRNNRNRLPQL